MSKEVKQPSELEQLKSNGTIAIIGATADEVMAKFAELKASAKGETLATGAVGYNTDGYYVLQISLIK